MRRRGGGVTNKYTAFKLLNLQTTELKQYPYINGWNSIDSENKAIKEQMELTGQPRSDFMVHGLVK